MTPWRRYRLACLKRRYLAGVAQWERDGRPLTVLPPEPPCPTGHLETVTIPNLPGAGTVMACAHCHRVLDQSTPVPDCTNPAGGHRFPACSMPGEPARGRPCIHCGLRYPAQPEEQQ